MQNNFEKFAFFGIIVVVVIFIAVAHPGIFINGNSAGEADALQSAQGASLSATNTPPIIVLPSLSADIGAQTPSTSFSNASSGGVMPPSIGSAAAVVADLETGDEFFSANANERWPMASVSKLMTAVIATDVLNPNQQVTITASMTAADPTEHILNIGDTYTVEDLLHIMLLPSNNVAAESLAQFYGRSRFLAAMNAKAQSWGMTDTYYDDPSGLSAANESTANDLLKLAQNIYTQYPEILAITRMPSATVNNLATGKQVTVQSINEFAGDSDFIGGKTGYTDQADGNLLSLFSYEGRPIFIMVLGIADGVRFDGTQTLYNWFKANYK